jgi:hypothetical protein
MSFIRFLMEDPEMDEKEGEIKQLEYNSSERNGKGA